jgi:POT family proton-dependent oligopeptide transporter
MIGHFILVINSINAFYLGLALIVLGCGLLKPNISTLVGRLYTYDDPRRD